MVFMKNLYNKYKDIIPYGICGVLTTLVNISTYYVFAHILNVGVLLSTIIAWLIAVLFAYYTNRKWVFHSKCTNKKDIVNELLAFFSCRLATGIVDWGCMLVFVNGLHLNDMVVKTSATILVIILNYIASKFVIFTDKIKTKNINYKSLLPIMSLMILTLIIGFSLTLNPSNVYGISYRDSSVFRNVAEVILQGGMPYRDIFDHKGPLLYIFNTIGQLINYNHGVWIIELIIIFITLLFTYKTFKLFCKSISSFIGTFTLSTILIQFLEGGNLPEEYALAFIAISLFVFIDYLKNNKISKFRIIACGASFAAVCLLKINMVTIWCVFPIGILIKLISSKDYKLIGRFILTFLIGFMIVTLPILTWLCINGAIDDFFEQYFLFNFTYTGNTRNCDRLSTIISFIKNNLIMICMLINIFIVLKEKNYISILNLIYICFTLLVTGISGTPSLHYGTILFSSCVYPIAKLLCSIENAQSSNKQLITFITLILLSILVGNIWLNQIDESLKNYSTKNEEKIENTISNDIKSLTSKEDYITVYGNGTIHYLLSNRKSASKYYYQIPIGTLDENILTDYLRDLEKIKPKLILIEMYDVKINQFLDKYRYKLSKNYQNGSKLYIKE